MIDWQAIIQIPFVITSFCPQVFSCIFSPVSSSSPAQNIIAEHEIRNISCAAQDPEDLCTFAYITKDLQTSHHYCHVFSTVDVVRPCALSLSPSSSPVLRLLPCRAPGLAT